VVNAAIPIFVFFFASFSAQIMAISLKTNVMLTYSASIAGENVSKIIFFVPDYFRYTVRDEDKEDEILLSCLTN
jgi:hypothetical protein